MLALAATEAQQVPGLMELRREAVAVVAEAETAEAALEAKFAFGQSGDRHEKS
jgi:hypothetical protein